MTSQQADLFQQPPAMEYTLVAQCGNAELSQYFTPFWAAAELWDRDFSWVSSADVVIEPTCGPGPFLAAIPESVPAFGVEIDPDLAAIARRETGRECIVGDVCNVAFPSEPTVAVGNPPFSLTAFERIMSRLHQSMPEGALAGFIIPAFFLQTPRSVIRLNDNWEMSAELLPRTLFPGLSKPLLWTLFTKGSGRTLVGMRLFAETNHIEGLDKSYRELLNRSRSSWVAAIARALVRLGGRARLDEIYRVMETSRPTATVWWKEQIRKVLRKYFLCVGDGEYALA